MAATNNTMKENVNVNKPVKREKKNVEKYQSIRQIDTSKKF